MSILVHILGKIMAMAIAKHVIKLQINGIQSARRTVNAIISLMVIAGCQR